MGGGIFPVPDRWCLGSFVHIVSHHRDPRSIHHTQTRPMGLPGRTAAPDRPLWHHPWPFLGSPSWQSQSCLGHRSFQLLWTLGSYGGWWASRLGWVPMSNTGRIVRSGEMSQEPAQTPCCSDCFCHDTLALIVAHVGPSPSDKTYLVVKPMPSSMTHCTGVEVHGQWQESMAPLASHRHKHRLSWQNKTHLHVGLINGRNWTEVL